MIKIPVSLNDIIYSTNAEVTGDANATDISFTGISTDSRDITPGCIYIAICGQKYDGHDYLAEAIEKGAKGLIINSGKTSKLPENAKHNIIVMSVKDTVNALGRIARYRRITTKVKVIAVTGSAGKTTTKDMLAGVMNVKYKLISTEANFNNEIGLPMTLLKLTEEHEIAVVEMGMRGLGEIEWLSYIAQPDSAVITNIGMAHIERLGSIQNILSAKMEIIEGMKAGGVVFLNGDDRILKDQTEYISWKKLTPVLCGTKDYCDIRAIDIEQSENGSSFTVVSSSGILEFDPFHIKLPVQGVHNILNAVCTSAVAIYYGIKPEAISGAFLKYRSSSMRMNILTNSQGIRIIDDTYNANPQSVKAALETLACFKEKGRKIAVLGTMLELGGWAPDAHRDIGVEAARLNIDILVLTGEYSNYTQAGAVSGGILLSDIICLNNNAEASEFLLNTAKEGDVVLVKGSRGMKMEEIVEVLKK